MDELNENIEVTTEETPAKTTSRRSASRKTKAMDAEAATTVDTATEEKTEKAAAPKKKTIVPKPEELPDYVVVRNGFQGKLVYKSPRTGELFVWDSFGDEQEIELRELRNAKSSAKKMFQNNWFMFDEDWVIDYLGVGQYYKHALKIDDFDEIFEKKPSELKAIVEKLTPGQKKSVRYRASSLIREGKIDSLSTIHALEEALNVELIEK